MKSNNRDANAGATHPSPVPRQVGVREAAVVCAATLAVALGALAGVVGLARGSKPGVAVAVAPVATPAAAVPSEAVERPSVEVVAAPRVAAEVAEVAAVEVIPAARPQPELHGLPEVRARGVVVEPPVVVAAPAVVEAVPAAAEPVRPAVEPRPVAAKPGRVPGKGGVAKRIDKRSEADLIKELQTVTETGLAPTYGRADYLAALAKRAEALTPAVGPLAAAKGRPEIAGLPFRFGKDAVLPEDRAKTLNGMSKAVRDAARNLDPAERKGDRPGVSTTDWILGTVGSGSPVWADEVAVSCVQQMFQAAGTDTRLQAEAALARVRSPETTALLVKWAVFDPNAGVRAAAITALADRDRAEVRDLLLGWVRYPWPRAVEHACEAIVELGLTDAVPALAAALDAPDPDAAFTAPLPGGGKGQFRRVLTRVSHVRNCLLCHPPGASREVLTAADPDDSLMRKFEDPSFEQYYEAPSSRLVTAAVTYLRQDFSATFPGKQHARVRRFDYFVSVRPADTVPPPARTAADPFKSAVRFAIAELAGDKQAADKAWLASQKKMAPELPDRNAADVARAVGLVNDPEAYAAMQSDTADGKWLGLELTPGALAEKLRVGATHSAPMVAPAATPRQTKVAVVAHLEPLVDGLDAAARFRADRLLSAARDPSTALPLSALLLEPRFYDKPVKKSAAPKP